MNNMGDISFSSGELAINAIFSLNSLRHSTTKKRGKANKTKKNENKENEMVFEH